MIQLVEENPGAARRLPAWQVKSGAARGINNRGGRIRTYEMPAPKAGALPLGYTPIPESPGYQEDNTRKPAAQLPKNLS